MHATLPDLPDRPLPPRSPTERLRAWLQWVGPGRLLGSAVVVLAVLAGGYWLVRPPAATTESKLPYAAPHPTATPVSDPSVAPVEATLMVVHVAGAVLHPDVYELPEGSRVIDAVQAAGGMAADANPDVVNLAARLADGQRIYVPRMGEAVPVVAGDAGTGSGSGAAAGPVNINTATADELDTLPGVGPATAAAILAHREQHGPFATVDALGDVRGIGPAKLEAIRGLVTV